MEWRYYRDRAAFIASMLEDALNAGDLDRASWILFEQARLLFTQNKRPSPPYEAEVAFGKNQGATSFSAKPDPEKIGDEYYHIIASAFESLKTSQKVPLSTSDIPGIAKIHRIWVGREPDNQFFNSVRSGNLALSKIWQDCRTHQKIEPEQFLWTNVRSLLLMAQSGNKLFGKLVIRNIEELESGASNPELMIHIRSFIHRKEYAFASDLLRYVILEQQGGIFMGTGWREAQKDFLVKSSIAGDEPNMAHQVSGLNFSRTFSPDSHMLKVFYYTGYSSYYSVNMPGSGDDRNYLQAMLKKSSPTNLAPMLEGAPDSDLIYVGSAHHPVIVRINHISNELFRGLNADGMMKFIGEYRKTRYQTLREKWLHDSAGQFGGNLKVEGRAVDAELRQSQVGELTNVYPLAQALTDFGYIRLHSPLAFTKLMKLGEEFRFQIRILPAGFFSQDLGLYRGAGSSWTRISLKDKLCSEY